MKRTIGIIIAIIGLIGTVIFGIQAAQNSESFNFLGIDIAVSQANWTPVIISAVVLAIGSLMLIFQPKQA